MRTRTFAAAAGCLLAAVACTETPSSPTLPARVALNTTAVTEPTSGPWARIVEGKTGPASLYALYVPRTWNGSAIYYAHGFRDAESPVDLRDQDGLYAARDILGAQGFAVAYSSYDANGFAVKDGALRTHQLRGLLAAELGGEPAHNYLMGHSLGAAVALEIAQDHPEQYDGALLLCGMVGGSLVETQYLGNVRALFDVFFPGRVPGAVAHVPEGTVVTLPQIIGAVQSNPVGLYAIASTAQTPLPYVPVGSPTDPTSIAFQTLVGSLYGAVSFHARGINNILDLTHGAMPFGNDGTTYSVGTPLLPPSILSPLLTAANAAVVRDTMDRSALEYLSHNFTPTGNLRIPVLTVHNSWDPAVPAFHEDSLRAVVESAGASAMLLQRRFPAYGHCAIPTAVVLQSFADLTGWVATGTKPAN